jgi:hemolysin activation/secretion protein
MADLPPYPPDAAPVAAIVAPARQRAEPLFVESNGYHYTVNGNTLLPPAIILSSLEGVEDPKAAIDALNRAYQKAGYFLTALRGEVQGKLVAIQVIHGRITEADVVPSLAPFFRSMEGREDIDRNTLIRESAMADFYAAREGVRTKVDFSPAQELGGSKITVTEVPIEGATSSDVSISFNNLGSRFSSRYVAQGVAVVRPGQGFEITANYSKGLPGLSSDSSGSRYGAAAAGISSVTPWGLYGATYTNTRYRIGESAAPVYPTGTIDVAAVNGTQLAYADETARLVFTESFTHTSNVVTVFDDTFTLTDQRYNFLSAGTNFSKSFAVLGENASFRVGLTVSQGISPRAGTLAPELPGVPDPRFTLVQGNLSYTQSLPSGYSAGLTWSGQWADATLPQNQQWVLGGLGNLTAWLPSVLVGDSGMLARASVYSPPWAWGDFSVTGSAFVEAGVVASRVTPVGTPVSRGLADAGLSLTGSLKPGTSATLAYALPVASRNLDQKALDRLDRAYLYFNLSQSF